MQSCIPSFSTQLKQTKSKQTSKQKTLVFLNQAKYHSTVEIVKNYSPCLSTGKAIPTKNANRRLNNTNAVTDVQEKWEYTENK